MARKGITKEQIFAAATRLQAAGLASTVQAVREQIGSGSYSTINTHLAEWRKEHAEQVSLNVPDMPEKIMTTFNQVWATAVKSAQDDVETQRQTLEAMRREMDKENASMVAEIKRLEKELEETIDKLETVAQESIKTKEGRVSAEKQIIDLRVENARLDERAKATEQQATDLREQLSKLQEQFTELAQQRDVTAVNNQKGKDLNICGSA
jgi:chromosome segregation ATPase